MPKQDLEVKRPLNAAIPLSSMTSTRVRRINDNNEVKPRVDHTIIDNVYGKCTPGLTRYFAFFIDNWNDLNLV